jgi:WD40 repeat protein
MHVKAEKDEHLSDDDDDRSNAEDKVEVFPFNGIEYATYQEMVNAKRKRNQEVLLNSGLLDSVASLKSEIAGSKSKPTTQGIKKRKVVKSTEREPYQRRMSSRQAGIQSDGLFVEEERSGRFTVAVTDGSTAAVAGSYSSGVVQGSMYVKEKEPEFYRDRINDGSAFSIEEAVELTGSKWVKESTVKDAQDFVHGTLSKLVGKDETKVGAASKKGTKSKSPRAVASPVVSSDDITDRIKDMTFKEEAVVAKVVPDRIYGIAAHPSTDQLIVSAGDKKGYVGIWNVDSRAKADDESSNDGVHLFKFHSGSCSSLQWTPSGDALFSSSYDGTVRVLDVASETFEQVFATYDSDDKFQKDVGYGMDIGHKYWTQYGCLDHRSHSGKCFFLSTSVGTAMHVDMRSKGGVTFHEELSEKKINSLSLHPNGYSLASAGLDGTVNVWDMRKFGDSRVATKKAAHKPVASYNGGRSVNSAFFSPSGQYMVSTTMSNKLDIFENAHLSASKSTSVMKPSPSVNHDNQTGRWLSTLIAQWHPVADIFVVGCMKHPRQIEVMDAKGKALHVLSGDALTAVASRCCFHQSTDQLVVVGGNSSGRVTIFRT